MNVCFNLALVVCLSVLMSVWMSVSLSLRVWFGAGCLIVSWSSVF